MSTKIPDVARQAPQLLLAEDDEDLRCALVELFTADGFAVESLASGDQLLEALQSRGPDALPDVVVTDHRMPGLTGLEVLARLNAAASTVPVVLITGFGAEVTRTAETLGATVFDKPFSIDELRAAVLARVDWQRRKLQAPDKQSAPREWFPGAAPC